MTKTILVVDKEPDFVHLVKLTLEREGYNILTAYNGTDALKKARTKPDLILLDVVLPDVDGWDVVRTLQQNSQTRSIPFIFVTGNGKDTDEIVGLELGAMDYITKPISDGRLAARIRAALRKTEALSSSAPEDSIVRIDGLEIDIPNFSVRIDGRYIVFPKKEFEVLAALVKSRGSVLSRQAILDAVWGIRSEVYDRTIDVHITKIREKLKEYGFYIETLKRVGYRFRI